MVKESIYTKKAPEPVGPYSQAIKSGSLVFVSGQVPIVPETGEVLTGDIRKQIRQVLVNMKEVLLASGSSMENVVKATLFISNMDEFPLINEVFGEFFSKNPPARACVEVSRLPKGVDIEIDAVALV